MDARELVARRLVVGLGGDLDTATLGADRAEGMAREAALDVSTVRTLVVLRQLGDLLAPAGGSTELLLDCLEDLTALRSRLTDGSGEAAIGQLCATSAVAMSATVW